MRFITLTQVNERSVTGRTYSAMEGTTSVFADDDDDMVALAKRMASEGKVKVLTGPKETKKAIVDHPGDDVKTETKSAHTRQSAKSKED